ncbi:hypothetical protein [Natrinema sp. DC36]|nr:hypothetical protein [Natrinema sp. DC36]
MPSYECSRCEEEIVDEDVFYVDGKTLDSDCWLEYVAENGETDHEQ